MGRESVLRVFQEQISAIGITGRPLKIGVIGGGPAEPELSIFKSDVDIQVTFLGVEPVEEFDYLYLDLNASINENLPKFDLIICSQVLEHLWHLPNAFSNFKSLLNIGGYIWVACPASNYVHGSPAYYSAGYAPEILTKLGEAEGLQSIASGFGASPREYISRHLLHYWFSEKELKNIWRIRFGYSGNILKKFKFNLMTLPKRLMLVLTPFGDKQDVMFSTESWALLKRTN